MKRLFNIIISLILIVFLTLIGLVTFIDPNRYKDNIVNAVQKSIHQPFTINGDIKWHFWPEFALLLQDAQVGDTGHNLHIQNMNIEVQLLPLLRQHVNMKIKDLAMTWQHGSEKFTTDVQNLNIEVVGLKRSKNSIEIDTVHIDDFALDKIYFDLLAMLSGFTKDQLIVNHFTMNTLTLHQLPLMNIDTQMTLQNNILDLKPFTANLFQGNINGDMHLNLQHQDPQAQINAHIQQAQLQPLLSYMSPNSEITGLIDLDLKVTTHGLDSLIMQQQAVGSGDVVIQNCIYHGKHLAKEMTDTVLSANSLKDALAMAEDAVNLSEAMIAQKHAGNKVAGKMTIHNGSVDAIDLMVNDHYEIKRYGPIDLAHQLVDLCFDFQKKSAAAGQ